ncbi:hypothetical protein GCM10023185_04750 [Hymenobacter saemangeumensis]|uniref:Transglutaminase-like domain-containing protein n=1 Tax=Hymenobacter saemangeumensis TaxID=1084522 RepID=A0ABP8I068_9BACT
MATQAQVAPRRLVYTSPLEEKALNATGPATEQTYLAQLLAIRPGANEDQVAQASKLLADLYALIDATKPEGKPMAKRVRTIFEQVHKGFLSKYEDKATFDQTMGSGIYNCVSASALYALIFEHYRIPYAIRQKPTHVYVVADPAASNIMVEGTDPQGGYFLPDARFKKAYVDYLAEGKLVSQEEVARLGVEEVFKQKFQADKTITLPQLISLQYYNKAVLALAEDDAEQAYRALQKAEKLFHTTETSYLLVESLRYRLNGISYAKMEDVEKLTDFYAYQPGSKYQDEAISDFRGLTQKFLMDKGDTATYRAVYKSFQGSVADSATRGTISFVYYMQRGRMKLLQQNYLPAFHLLMQAYHYNPTSPELQGMVNALVQQESSRSGGGIRMLRQLDLFVYEHPREKGTPLLAQAYLHTYGRTALDYFAQDKRAEGKKYLALFEQAQSGKGAAVENEAAANVYLAASLCSGRANDLPGVKAYARKGLSYEPSNPSLQRLASLK